MANEIMDGVKIKKKYVIIFKVDFKKDYDSLDWNFLIFVKEKMAFHEK